MMVKDNYMIKKDDFGYNLESGLVWLRVEVRIQVKIMQELYYFKKL